MTTSRPRGWVRAVATVGLFTGAVFVTGAATPPAEIVIPDQRVFPESITAGPDGSLIMGSFKGVIYRAAPGEGTARPWIASGTNGLMSVTGVLADARTNTLWACSGANARMGFSRPAGEPTEYVKAFDLKSGAPKGSYIMPGGGVGSHCNDFAVGPDGTLYATDTSKGRVLRLKPGATELEIWKDDPLLAGANGIAVMDKSTLYVGSSSRSTLVRVGIDPDGSAGKAVELKLSAPIGRPDGLRVFAPNKLIYVEPSGLTTVPPLSGRLVLVTLDGDNANIRVLKDGYQTSPSSLVRVGDIMWIGEAKLAYLNQPTLQDKDPSPFKLTPFSLKGLH